MGEKVDYIELYKLQDKVLKVISELDNDFYLTGGTALHRFYFNARYSDDLDLFVSSGYNFKEDIDEIIRHLSDNNFRIEAKVKTRDFYRLMVNKILQLDFVNDRVFRYGKSELIEGIRVDNKLNILTNKIAAIIGRDEEKDLFDIMCFAFFEDFNWGEMLGIANKKAVVEKDILIYRIASFPLPWLERIKKLKNIEITKEHIEILETDILNERNNSLKKYGGF
jgi:predicted nucleotidyltransferase component of viral defense system